MTSCSAHRLLGTGEFTDTSNRVWCGLFTGKVADGLRLKISEHLPHRRPLIYFQGGHREKKRRII